MHAALFNSVACLLGNMQGTVAVLMFEPFQVLACGERPKIIETFSPFPPTILDPSGSMFSNATVVDAVGTTQGRVICLQCGVNVSVLWHQSLENHLHCLL
jgi:hypothetical protein